MTNSASSAVGRAIAMLSCVANKDHALMADLCHENYQLDEASQLEVLVALGAIALALADESGARFDMSGPQRLQLFAMAAAVRG